MRGVGAAELVARPGRVGRLNLVDWTLGLLVLGSAMAVKPLALIWDLAQMDILTIRVLK